MPANRQLTDNVLLFMICRFINVVVQSLEFFTAETGRRGALPGRVLL